MRYKRILLIQPNYPDSHYQSPTFPIGLGYIAEALKAAAVEYKVADMGVEPKYARLVSRIQVFRPSLIGISMMSSMYRRHYELAKKLKNDFANIDIVAGGPHISTFRQEVLKECKEIDYGITLEGEKTIVELCQGLNAFEIKGLIFRNDDDIHYTGDRLFINDLDSIPFPTYEGFKKYDKTAINIISSRGCPYSCIYCPVKTTIGRKLRVRSALNLVDEIEFWYKRGYQRFSFVDDNFTFYKKRVSQICDEIDKRGIRIEMNCPNGVRADKIDRALLQRMRNSGFLRIGIGVEAGTDRVLKNIKKGERLSDITAAIKDACDLGFEVVLFFLIGSPGERPQDIEESFKIARKYNVKDVRFYNLIPFPGTELYKWVSDNNYFVRYPEDYFNSGLHWVNEPVFYTPTLSIKQRKEAFRRGMSMGNRLRSTWRYSYYLDSLRKFGFLTPVIAYIASRTITQDKLLKLRIFHYVRHIFKKYELFSPKAKISGSSN
jgi:radical SAM superfamily enzyme YgiQ (UPF0313 family)